jgi:hypothetical protein
MPHEPPRLIEGAFLCDHATNYGHRLSVLGAFVNLVFAPSLPHLTNLTLVIRIAFIVDASEARKVSIGVEVSDPADQRVMRIDGEIGMAEFTNPHPEMPAGANMIVPLVMPLSSYGVHRVKILVDGDLVEALPFKVVERPPAE